MKKGFFSFVAITLVALVLFVAASYLFTFKDFRYTAQKDLEVRRVAERMEDAKFAINKTIVDSATDAGYKMWGCGSSDLTENYCASFASTLENYTQALGASFSDSLLLNVTLINYNCTNVTSSADYSWDEFTGGGVGVDVKVNITRRVNGTMDINISYAGVNNYAQTSFYFDADLTRTDNIASLGDVFVMRLLKQGVNSTNYDHTIGVKCT